MNLRQEVKWLWPIGLLIIVALACGTYILTKQRLESPFEEKYGLNVEVTAADGVTADAGSPVTVAGVGVGQIDGVKFENGRAVIHASMNPEDLPHVYRNARAALIPNTPLKDMQIQLYPGSKSAGELGGDGTIKVGSTTSPVDADEFLHALDTDTRTYFQAMLSSLSTGFKGRGRDLRRALRNLGPTAAQMRRVTALLAARRHELPKLVHNLAVIGGAGARSDTELRKLVEAGNATLATFAANDVPLRATLRSFPPTLEAARGTLRRTPGFANALSRSVDALNPSLERAKATIEATPGATRGLVPLPAKQFTQFVNGISPLQKYVRPATADFASASDPLVRAFGSLGRTTNALAYQESPQRKSYLFWLAWFAHNANSAVSSGDANGAVFRGFALFSCSSNAISPTLNQLISGLTGTQSTCPGGGNP